MTDANLLLGYLGEGSRLAGGLELERAAAERSIAALADRLGIDRDETAAGILRVADQEMVRALRVVTVERGVDPRRFTLVAFGGAGPMHAARIATELGIRKVLCPLGAGVLSAWGLAISDRRRDFARTLMSSGSELRPERIAAATAQLRSLASEALPAAELEFGYDLRYRGQAFELRVEAGPEPSIAQLRAAFDRAHEARYGYADSDAALELVNVRVAAVVRRPSPPVAAAAPPPAIVERRPAMFDRHWVDTTVVRGIPAPGEPLPGPAIVELGEATIVVPPGWSLCGGANAILELERV